VTNPIPLLQTRIPGLPDHGPFQVDLLVRVQAPGGAEPDARPRPPLHLAVVLDRSGSMSGEPLRQAGRCAGAIMARLAPLDRVALVAFDNRAQLLRACLPVTDLEADRQVLARVRPGGCTDLHQGWAMGVAELAKVHAAGVVSRVLLLSDGQANEGIVDPGALAEACAQAQAAGVSTSTYGLGPEFGEGVMTAMARHGQGRSYYGETAEDLLDPFMEEFDLLSNLVARGLTLSMAALPGLTVTQRNGYLPDGHGGWRLPDLPALGEAWALFRLEGRIEALAPWQQDGHLTLGTVALRWRDPDGRKRKASPLPLRLPLLPEAGLAALPQDPLVARRMAELAAADLQERAHQAAQAGAWEEVGALLDQLREVGKDHPWTRDVVDELEALMREGRHDVLTKEFLYTSGSSRNRVAGLEEDGPDAPPAQSYLRRKRRQGSQRGSEPRNTPPEPDAE